MEKDKINEKEALDVIEEMINKSRYKLEKEAKYFLLWGWMVFAAAIIHFTFILLELDNSWIVWPVLMVITTIIYCVMIYKSDYERRAKSYIDRINLTLWLGIVGPTVITILIGAIHSWTVAYPVFMAIYGWSALVSGGVLKFKPLVLGGIFSMVIGVVSVFVPGIYLLLFLALAVLVSFIIPGYSLRRAR